MSRPFPARSLDDLTDEPDPHRDCGQGFCADCGACWDCDETCVCPHTEPHDDRDDDERRLP
jgi:hypothetical protein